MNIKVAETALLTFGENVLQRAGLPPEDACTVADSLLFANLRGIDSHGFVRLPPYVRRLEVGGTKAMPRIKVVREMNAAALVDGDNGMGQVVGMAATKLAVRKAKEFGTSFIGVRRSGHNGAISYYAVKMAEVGMVGVATSNTTPVMAAWGGTSSVIGNNPLAIAVPYRDGQPLVFDAAMSRVAGGKVRLAAARGERIPTDWILDGEGHPTDDPNAILEGALLPFGEHKGFGLAVMIEVLSAVITGAGLLKENPFWASQPGMPLNIGHAFMALDITTFMEVDLFQERLHWMVKTLKSSPPASGFSGVVMPGEQEAEIEDERRRNGIPISEEVWEELQKLGRKYKVTLLSMS